MIMVMASITVLTLLITAAVGYAMAAMPQARHDQDWNAAMAAAQSGVDDYVARLNQNDSYWQTVDCTNTALKGGKNGTNSCGWTTSTSPGWQLVEPGNSKGGQFHYDVSTAGINSQGYVQVTSTGQVNGVSRTIQANVGRGGSTNFLYYTDFEDADPANTYVYPSGASTQCGGSGPTNAKYYWPSGRSGCVEITFVGGDTLDGAVHFNDTPLISGTPLFKKGFETADPNCATTPYSESNCYRGSGNPNLNGLNAQAVGLLNLPDNSNQFVNFPGCQYTGDTRIKFNSNGTMTVWNKGGVSGTNCGSASQLASTNGQSGIPVPTDQVIYVRNAATQTKCTAGQIGDGLPLSGDVNIVGSNALPQFYCGNGNLYVEGTLGGRVTAAAQNDIIVTNDLLLANTTKGQPATGPDMLGLVAGNSVVVYHPVNSSGNELVSISDRWIYGSIQTLQHSFWVQNYNNGSTAGTAKLHVRGSIAQRWRGIVGTSGGTGYLKDYGYDTRLKYTSPPYFPQWTNAVWKATTTGELKPAY
ncbi:MAG TPA: hypothetical protein VIM19_02270 [Actinomycetes bacterium]